MRRNKIKNILIINPFGIGDVLFSTPSIEVVKKNFPDSYIAYICNIRTKEILETNPDINEIFVFEKDVYRALWKESRVKFLKSFTGFLKKIKKKKFDLAIDYSLGHQYSLFLMLMGVRNRIGFNYKGRGRFLTQRIDFAGFDDKSIADYYLDVLGLMGLNINEARIKLWPTKEDENYIDEFLRTKGIRKDKNMVCIAPGGGVSFGKEKINFKRWGPSGFAALADRLISELGCTVIFIWGPKEEALINEISEKMSNQAVIAPRTTLRQMAALMKSCYVCICNDAGPLHVAVSQNCRTVSIFGPSDENSYGPYPLDNRHIVVTGNIECRPCYKRFKLPDCKERRCLESVSADDVFIAVKKQLESSK